MKESQSDIVVRHMNTHGSITTIEAFEKYGITRLAARIHDIQAEGIPIERKMEHGKNRYGEKVRYMRYWRAS